MCFFFVLTVLASFTVHTVRNYVASSNLSDFQNGFNQQCTTGARLDLVINTTGTGLINYVKLASFEYNKTTTKLLDVEMKMLIAQPLPHQQQQKRGRHEAQTSEKRKMLLRQNLHTWEKFCGC